jgi:hypothetical protein
VFGASDIFFVGAGAVQTGNNPTVPVPAGYAAGDLLVIACSGPDVDGSPPPSGYTSFIEDVDTGRGLRCFYKVSTASESDPEPSNLGGTAVSVVLCYRGINATPFDVDTAVTFGSSTSPATISLTTASAYELVISFYGWAENTATITAPASTTERINQSSDTGTNCGLLVVDEIKRTAGATTIRTATLSTSRAWATASVAFKPV